MHDLSSTNYYGVNVCELRTRLNTSNLQLTNIFSLSLMNVNICDVWVLVNGNHDDAEVKISWNESHFLIHVHIYHEILIWISCFWNRNETFCFENKIVDSWNSIFCVWSETPTSFEVWCMKDFLIADNLWIDYLCPWIWTGFVCCPFASESETWSGILSESFSSSLDGMEIDFKTRICFFFDEDEVADFFSAFLSSSSLEDWLSLQELSELLEEDDSCSDSGFFARCGDLCGLEEAGDPSPPELSEPPEPQGALVPPLRLDLLGFVHMGRTRKQCR